MFSPPKSIVKSSAYMIAFTGLLIVANIELTTIMDKVTLSTDPCGIPFSCYFSEDSSLLTRTWNILSCRNPLMKLNMGPLIPKCFNLFRISRRHTVSLALLKSKNIEIHIPLLARIFLISVSIYVMLSIVLLYLLKPHWWTLI